MAVSHQPLAVGCQKVSEFGDPSYDSIKNWGYLKRI